MNYGTLKQYEIDYNKNIKGYETCKDGKYMFIPLRKWLIADLSVEEDNLIIKLKGYKDRIEPIKEINFNGCTVSFGYTIYNPESDTHSVIYVSYKSTDLKEFIEKERKC